MKQGISGIFLLFVTPLCLASNPASTAYVDAQFATIQTQINQIKTNPAIAHPVGSCYGGGVVFYVNPDPNAAPGDRGLIVARGDTTGTTDGSTMINGCTAGSPVTCEWNTSGFSTPAVTYTSSNPSLYFTGAKNTDDIRGTATSGTWSAADAAYYYNTTNPPPTCTGCTSWYLPSQDELAQLYFTQANNPNFWANSACPGTAPASVGYWSSSQVTGNPTGAWLVDFGVGFVGHRLTFNPLGVRTVRAF